MHQDSDLTFSKVVEWNGVRPIYKKLSDEFHVLLNAFDVTIDPSTKLYLDHLICCIDRVDGVLDNLTIKDQRQGLSESMINLIEGDIDVLPKEYPYPSLQASLINLRVIALKLNIKHTIVNAAKIIFKKTEDKRHELDVDSFISMVQEEGVATAALPLSIIGQRSNENFSLFFTKLCRLMGVADLVADAKSDFRSGLISFKPTVRIYIKLIGLTISEGFKLLLLIPHKLRFLQYCLRFSTILWKS